MSESNEALQAELERLRSENAALKSGAAAGITMKVSGKGALSVYGMGRFPVTLYQEQWLKLMGMSDQIRAFIAANSYKLKPNSARLHAGVGHAIPGPLTAKKPYP